MNKYLISFTLLAVANGAASATPTIVEGPSSKYVSVADLNLSSQAGLHTLEARIRGAARKLCSSSGVQQLSERMKANSCYRSAVADADRQVQRRTAKRSTGA